MLDTNGNLTEAAEKYLTPEEINLFNSLERRSESWMLERQSSAIRLFAAAIQRKALFDIEQRGKETATHANRIAALAAAAIVLQVIVEIFK